MRWLGVRVPSPAQQTRRGPEIVVEGCPSGQREQTVNLPAHAFEGSNPSPSTIHPTARNLLSGNSSAARASAFQAEGRGFESRFPLHAPNGEPGGVSRRVPSALGRGVRSRKSRFFPRFGLTSLGRKTRFPVSCDTLDDFREEVAFRVVCPFLAHPGSQSPPTSAGTTITSSRIRAEQSAGMVAVVRAHVAQSVEHLHGKEKVIGSIPIVGSTCTRVAPVGVRRCEQLSNRV